MFYLDNNMKKNLKISIIIIIISICLIIISAILKSDKQEDELSSKLYTLGSTYYENVYYDDVLVDDIKSLENDGLRINLKELISAIYYQDPNEFVNDKTNEKCNYLNSYVIIYPYSPYGKKDYTLNINLDCGF